MDEQKKQSSGAMWSKVSKNEKQTKYYTISLDTTTLMDENGNIPEKVSLIAFRNFYKTEERQPDYKIYKSEKKEYNVGSEKREYKRRTEKEDDEYDKKCDEGNFDDNEIPF